MSAQQTNTLVEAGTARGGTNWILLVDDDVDLRETMQALLEDDGYQVVAAEDGADALRRLPDMPLPDLIILDLQMPRLNGVGFMAAFAKNPAWTDVPVLIVSGDPRGAEKAAQMGAHGYLVKPVRIHELSVVVAKMSGHS